MKKLTLNSFELITKKEVCLNCGNNLFLKNDVSNISPNDNLDSEGLRFCQDCIDMPSRLNTLAIAKKLKDRQIFSDDEINIIISAVERYRSKGE